MQPTPGHSRGLTNEEICELLECTSDTECFSESSNSSESDSVVLDDIVGESEDEIEDVQYTDIRAPETLQPLTHPFQELPGPKHMPPVGSPVIEYFNLFFTTTLLQLIVTDTDHSAKQFITKHATLSKPYKKWKNVTSTEVRGFIACLLNMGLNKRPTMLSYWSTKPSQAFSWFGKMFSAHQFRHLMKFFHFVDSEKCPAPGHPHYDPCIRYQPSVHHANNIFRHHYTPHEQLSIDESLVCTKCHTSLLKYLPNKHHHQ
ncbi:piggyBac transposable element-derived protein 4-like [Schistocerca gregaria]|uniref:piggyBac transposable element-derived protein 4-like n=1 Tax=Schistocerca gregaria TaxID=7010 RepID=UPI00211DC858|nr:piggyBac transposable element-derived protein 4-like [Schistocerca gregaria]